MKIKLTSMLVLLSGILSLTAIVGYCGGKTSTSWNLTEVAGTSSTVFNGSGYIKGLYLSSDTETTIQNNYVMVVDSPLTNSNSPSVASYLTAQRKTPTIVFQSTYTVGMPNGWSAPDSGVYISSGATVYKSVTNSGEARKAFLLWSK